MKNKKLNIAFFGSSILSAYWNGAATYYRGIVRALHNMGHEVTFYEPDVYDRQKHRDIEPPNYCNVEVYENDKNQLRRCLKIAEERADIIIKTSGIGAFDEFLEREIPKLKRSNNVIIFWDVDAPATLDRMINHKDDAFRDQLPKFDGVLTYGGGEPVVKTYQLLGAKKCIPIYNAFDPDTHHPVPAQEKFSCHLGFLGNRLPDREARVEEFFIKPAQILADKKFIIGGSGWQDKPFSKNVKYCGHVYTNEHNAFNSSSLAILNISRGSMAEYGYSPATRVFEAAGAAACIITDYWEGIEMFFEPDKEILVARDGDEVVEILKNLTPEKAKKIGDAAYQKVISKHTYSHRTQLLNKVLTETLTKSTHPLITQSS